MKQNSKFLIFIVIGIIIILIVLLNILTSSVDLFQSKEFLIPLSNVDSVKTKNIVVKITKNLDYFIDENSVNIDDLENELRNKQSDNNQLTIIIKAEKSVPIKNIVGLMDLANRNKFKVILAVKPNN